MILTLKSPEAKNLCDVNPKSALIIALKKIQLNDQYTNACNYKTVRDMKKIIADPFSGGQITSYYGIKILGWSGPLKTVNCIYFE